MSVITVELPARPKAGFIPRGVFGHAYRDHTKWFCLRSDLVQAHKSHVFRARVATLNNDPACAAWELQAAGAVRRLLS